MSIQHQLKPTFYKSLMYPGFFPDSNKIVKYQESYNYWIFKTGKKVFKIKKKESSNSAVPLEKVFCMDVVNLVRKHSPGLAAEIKILCQRGNDFILLKKDEENSATPLFYVIEMNQLSESSFLNKIILKKKLTEKIILRVSEFLNQFHAKTEVSNSKENVTAMALELQLRDLYYQSKKYLGQTITQPIIDMTSHPLEKFLHEHKKLFLKRIKKNKIKLIHGCFIPRKIHVSPQAVLSLGKTSEMIKNHFSDSATDVADLIVELKHHGNEILAHKFVEAYIEQSDDREMLEILPFYEAMKCLAKGLKYSAAIQLDSSDKKAENTKRAKFYYNQTIEITRTLT